MRIGVGGERFRLRPGLVSILFGIVLDPPPAVFVALALDGKVLALDGLALALEVTDG